ncbi:hypothetical protein N7517_003901 [Penicillium concentricum]|uniref:DUF202 domain-containing protein n=1 Tax=Penicillium concentricum TaxID=293559 RepID=A0A9W9S5T7_9EURO|nr:uncharacterized protein N7517_003901 [Penicillium concentricum]KAJ5371895.1 hypothetical protein N7517_003901 [Penicillium concentricum]
MNLPLFRRLLPKPVINNGSQLRDHQANERTFLSWSRMGLAFAAMSLALARLDIIDNIFNRGSRDGTISSTRPASRTAIESKGPDQAHSRVTKETPVLLRYVNDRTASRVCQAISIWSFGYSLARYISVRRNLLQGRYVPSIWGPVLITCGSLTVFGMTLKLE